MHMVEELCKKQMMSDALSRSCLSKLGETKVPMTPLVLTSIAARAQESGWKLADPATQSEASLACSGQPRGFQWLPVTPDPLWCGAHR